MVKIVNNDNQLVMEHAQVLEHRSRNTIVDDGKQILKHEHRCFNTKEYTDAATQNANTDTATQEMTKTVKDCH
jgi:hypothetical protein